MVSKLKQLWSSEQGLQGAAVLLMVTMLLSNILGFLRDALLANVLPFSVLDTYYAAFRLPDLLFNLFILGAISSAFIPVFTDIKTKQGEAASWRVANNLLNTALVVLIAAGIVLYILMPKIMPLFVPDFPADKIAATIPLARILLISPLFFALSYIASGILNVYNRFFSYSIAPLVYNLSIVVGGILSRHFGITAVAVAVVVGAFLHLLAQVPALVIVRYRYRPVLDWRDKSLGRIIRLMVPRSISLGMGQLVLVAFTRIGSGLPSGSITIYNLTNNFQTTPTAIFAASIATSIFPTLVASSTRDDQGRFRTVLTESIRGMLFFTVPSMVLLWVVRAHTIRLYLALNGKTWTETIRAIDTFQWFILSLAAQGLSIMLMRAYYARQETRQPLLIAIASGVIAIAAAYGLTALYPDVPSLSLAFTVSSVVEALIFWIAFRLRWPELIDVPAVFRTGGITIAMSIAAGLLARLTLSIVSDGLFIPPVGLGTEHVIPLFIALVAASVVGVTSYLGLAYAFERDELRWLFPKRAARQIVLPDSEGLAKPEGLSS